MPDHIHLWASLSRSSDVPFILKSGPLLTVIQAAPTYNYPAVCAIYFLASIGLGGNIPIDATIALEFLPQKRRFLVALLSMWQPIGVVAASGIAYGTAAKYRCDIKLPSCKAVAAGQACCTPKSNMGWRYNFIVLGFATLLIFFLRYVVFKFHESPKFLLARGREAEAIEVLHRIAKFNKAPPPTLTMEMFAAIDEMDNNSARGLVGPAGPQSTAATTKVVVKGFAKEVARIKGVFTNKLSCFIFILLGIAYMVNNKSFITQSSLANNLQGDYWSFNLAGAFLPIILLRNNVSSGQGTVTDTYQQYIIIYAPGILGAVLALFSIQLPLVGRKWSLVFSAICQGLAMAMYTQVKTTKGYVGLNALEYIMQTVSTKPDTTSFSHSFTKSTSTRFCTHLRPSFSTRATAVVSAACCPAWDVLPVSLHHMLASSSWQRRARVFCGLELVVSGWLLS